MLDKGGGPKKVVFGWTSVMDDPSLSLKLITYTPSNTNVNLHVDKIHLILYQDTLSVKPGPCLIFV